LKYIISKQSARAADDTSATAAEKLIGFLENSHYISYVLLTDNPETGLLAMRGKGRPRKVLPRGGLGAEDDAARLCNSLKLSK
jgi:hypothetical protein